MIFHMYLQERQNLKSLENSAILEVHPALNGKQTL